ncbi:MAG: helix-turn-helix domain-containing protein, partial [Oscillospiraceae bacterium]|nr:helix-turn-helix domain-containing protein [Oscillospiraceae bacterium]
FSQQVLAEKLGVSRSTVAMWETGGAQPDHKTLLQLSALLNASIDEMLGNKNAPALESAQGELCMQDSQLLALFSQLSQQDKGRLLERAEMLAAQTRE